MNWYEFQPKQNDKGQAIYQDACTVTIVTLGETKSYAQRDFQSIGILDANNQTIKASISYAKSDVRLLPTDLNKPYQCRVKAEPNTTQYAYQGCKFTFAPIGKPGGTGGASGGGGSSQSGYKAGGGRSYGDDPVTAWSKCRHGIICAHASAGSVVDQAALDEQVAMCFAPIPDHCKKLLVNHMAVVKAAKAAAG